MRSAGLVLITVFSSTLGSPFPGPEAAADPAYGVIKTIKIWDEDSSGRELLEDALEIGDEEIDLNALLDQQKQNEEEPKARNLLGYIDGSGNFIGNRQGDHHHNHHQSHDGHHTDQRHASHHHDARRRPAGDPGRLELYP